MEYKSSLCNKPSNFQQFLAVAIIAVVLATERTFAEAKPLQLNTADQQYYGDSDDYNDSRDTNNSSNDDNTSTSVYDENAENYSSADYDGGDFLSRLVKRSDDSANQPQPPDATPTTTTATNTSESSDNGRSSSTGSISISDLIGAVEHSLVHSAQTLSLSNATNGAVANSNSTESSTVIAVPIALATTSTTTTSTTTPTPATTSTTEESTLLIPINADAANNITILQTINSTQVHSSADDATMVDRIQHQHITLFSAGAGVFPQLPAIKLRKSDDDSNSEGEDSEEVTTSAGHTTDCNTNDSNESDDDSSSAKVVDSGSAEPVEKCPLPVSSQTSTAMPTISPSTSSTTEQSEGAKEQLKTKIAEVEAEPVILTQGI